MISGAVIGTTASASEADELPVVAELEGLDAAAADRFVAHRETGTGLQTAAVPPGECRTATDVHKKPIMVRYAGANRYETAACVSFWTWSAWDADVDPDFKAKAVVLASGDAFPDALAGGPLAAHAQGPLLLSPPDELPPAIMTEIQRVLAPGGLVYLLGGATSLSNAIRNELQAASFTTRRLAGSNRYETAVAIADELPDTSNFFFVTGDNFPDALGAGTAAATLSLDAKLDTNPDTRPYVMLLTDDATMPTATRDFAIARGNQFREWTLVTAGGAADQAAVATFGADSLAARFVGSNRYETAALIAEEIFSVDGALVGFYAGLATGLHFPDALPAASSLALVCGPLLLTPSSQLNTSTRNFLVDHKGQGHVLDVFGGTSAISNTVAKDALAAFSHHPDE